jgi:hypothetical protein
MATGMAQQLEVLCIPEQGVRLPPMRLDVVDVHVADEHVLCCAEAIVGSRGTG